jgi:hypothetical protein
MREILCRGKRIDNGKWIYGFYHRVTKNFIPENGHYITCFKDLPNGETILTESYEVIPESVSLYTGCVDRNSVKIFEGDIAREGCNGLVREIIWDNSEHVYKLKGTGYGYTIDDSYIEWTIIGNIFDHPELLKEER